MAGGAQRPGKPWLLKTESTWNTWALIVARSSLARIQLTGLRPNPALPRSSQWAPKACLAGSLPGPVGPLCECCQLPDLKLCLWPGLGSACWSPPLPSSLPGEVSASWVLSLVGTGQLTEPRPTQTLSLPAAGAQPGSAQSGTALQPPRPQSRTATGHFFVHTCAPSQGTPDNQVFGSQRRRTYPQENIFGVLLNVSAFYFSSLQLRKSPLLPLCPPTT